MTYSSKLIATLLTSGLLAVGSTQVLAADPYEKPNASWISLTGTVASAGDAAFTLDYGEGLITVEMDDWDWYDEGRYLIEGDRVTVHGRIDADFYQLRTVEASSVYLHNLNTTFYANALDEEDARDLYYSSLYVVPTVDGRDIQLTGTVKAVNGREFKLDTGTTEIQVNTNTMAYNPMDDEGFQHIEKGDLVTVSGDIDIDLFERNEILADAIVTLMPEQ